MKLPQPSSKAAANRGLERWYDQQQRQEDDSLRRFMADVKPSSLVYQLLVALFGNSPYLTQLVIQHPQIIRRFVEQGASVTWTQNLAEIDTECTSFFSVAIDTNTFNTKTFSRILRRAKQKAALIIAIADTAQIWPVTEVMTRWSHFADRLIQYAVQYLLARLIQSNILTVPDAKRPEIGSGFFVLALGKLGGNELNYSSDIDLIALYDDETVPITKHHDMSRILVRLTKDLVQLLEQRTDDGYVFRTDLRLRPDPGATALALSVSSAETYYGHFGQNWERAALIKARWVAGDAIAAQRFLAFLHRFIWRRALDFATIQDIHSIKRQINTHKGYYDITLNGHDIKLGHGGIREIEFFVQTQQLIYGGRDPHQRSPTTCDRTRCSW